MQSAGEKDALSVSIPSSEPRNFETLKFHIFIYWINAENLKALKLEA